MKARGVQSWTSILLGGAVLLVLGWLTWHQLDRPVPHSDAGAVVVGSAASVSTALPVAGDDDAAAIEKPLALDSLGDGGLALTSPILADGGAMMPTTAPRSVKIGVVLVAFVGAEGAPNSARPKPEALKHALSLVETAREDWKAAVKAGDQGSAEDIGRMPRGVLETATEIVVFSLGKGDVSEPLETPRGYWIVKRLD